MNCGVAMSMEHRESKQVSYIPLKIYVEGILVLARTVSGIVNVETSERWATEPNKKGQAVTERNQRNSSRAQH